MNIATPREVGYLPSILRARKKLELQLSSRQVEILVGSVLGDGYISPRGQIQLEHSEKHQAYLLWKFKELENVAYGHCTMAERWDKRYQKKYRSYRFWTRQYFRPWRDYFYQNKKKIFPIGLALTPMSLAVWYMDDGCYSSDVCTIAIENFAQPSRQLIQEELQQRFKIETYIRSNGKLAIRASCRNKFFTLVRPYIHNCMLYKIP